MCVNVHNVYKKVLTMEGTFNTIRRLQYISNQLITDVNNKSIGKDVLLCPDVVPSNVLSRLQTAILKSATPILYIYQPVQLRSHRESGRIVIYA